MRTNYDNQTKTGIICPCCGFDNLRGRPYSGIITYPIDKDLEMPYSKHLGEPSYGLCPCCDYYYGIYDDVSIDPEDADPVSFHEHLCKWIKRGAHWNDTYGEFNRKGHRNPDFKREKPENWNLVEQLKNIKVDFDTLGLKNPQVPELALLDKGKGNKD